MLERLKRNICDTKKGWISFVSFVYVIWTFELFISFFVLKVRFYFIVLLKTLGIDSFLFDWYMIA